LKGAASVLGERGTHVAGERVLDLVVVGAGPAGLAVAIARGTPAKPLCEPEDLYEAKILEVSNAAEKLGVKAGMTGRQAVETMLAARP